MIPSVRCFMKRVDGGANVQGDASIGVRQSNGRRGHEDEGESVLFLQLWEPPAIAIGVATEKVGSKSSDLEVGTLSRDRRRLRKKLPLLPKTVRYGACTVCILRYSPPSKIRSSHTFPA